MNESQKLGSDTAKGGFRNEDDVVSKFNNWDEDEDARKWLSIMGYDLNEIESVNAVKLHGFKTDVQVQVEITIKLKNVIEAQNLQVKLVSNMAGFNQIDKRWVHSYIDLWDMPTNIESVLMRFTGEESPNIDYPRDKRRMFIDEFTNEEKHELLEWLKSKKTLIVSDILKGRGKYSAEWILVVQKVASNSRWVLVPMNKCLNHFGNGDVVVSPRGSIKIGRITMQRKGGDGGRNTANMLQFKINPAELFSI